MTDLRLLSALVGTALIFAFAVTLRGYGWDDALIGVVALVVGLIPKACPPSSPSACSAWPRAMR